MVDNQDTRRTGQAHAYHALATVFAQGFRFLAIINGAGVLLTLFGAVGVIPTNLAPQLFRMPLAAFIGGLALCGVGLLWSYLVQTSLFGQLVEGRHRRTHWVPLFCTLVAYGLSLVVFVVGCWFTLGLANLAYYHAWHSQSYGQQYDDDGAQAAPFDQSARPLARASGTVVDVGLYVGATGRARLDSLTDAPTLCITIGNQGSCRFST